MCNQGAFLHSKITSIMSPDPLTLHLSSFFSLFNYCQWFFSCLLQMCFPCLSFGLMAFIIHLTGAHVFGALVVACSESQINAACCMWEPEVQQVTQNRWTLASGCLKIIFHWSYKRLLLSQREIKLKIKYKDVL